MPYDYIVDGIRLHRPANMEYRHELDCFLRVALSLVGDENLPIGEYYDLEEQVIHNLQKVSMLFSEDGRCVVWSFDGEIAEVNPLYKNCEVYRRRKN